MLKMMLSLTTANIGLVRTLEQRLVGDDVAQQEAHATLGGAIRAAGHYEQAALLAVQAPVLARAHMVDQQRWKRSGNDDARFVLMPRPSCWTAGKSIRR